LFEKKNCIAGLLRQRHTDFKNGEMEDRPRYRPYAAEGMQFCSKVGVGIECRDCLIGREKLTLWR